MVPARKTEAMMGGGSVLCLPPPRGLFLIRFSFLKKAFYKDTLSFPLVEVHAIIYPYLQKRIFRKLNGTVGNKLELELV